RSIIPERGQATDLLDRPKPVHRSPTIDPTEGNALHAAGCREVLGCLRHIACVAGVEVVRESAQATLPVIDCYFAVQGLIGEVTLVHAVHPVSDRVARLLRLV